MQIISPEFNEYIKLSNNSITNLKFGLYSSIYKPFPTAYISYVSDLLLPDSLNLLIGSLLDLQYKLSDDSKINSFPNLCIEEIQSEGDSGLSNNTVFLKSELAFNQNSNIRKGYIDSYGNEIIKDVYNSNEIMRGYETNFEKTDNTDTVYRSLGEMDLSFIQDDVCNKFVINNGKPLFYLGLDKKINFSSLNKLSKNSEYPLGVLYIAKPSQKVSSVWVSSKTKSKGLCELLATTWSLSVGSNEAYKAIKPTSYSTLFTNPYITQTFRITTKPAQAEKTYLPINKNFVNTIESTDSAQILNRPDYNLKYEIKDIIGDLIENLITIKIKNAQINYLKDDKILVAGDNLFVWFGYEYSMYNGVYTIVDIEYTQADLNTSSVNLMLARSHLDTSFTDYIDVHKNSKEFIYPYAPIPSKNILYTGN